MVRTKGLAPLRSRVLWSPSAITPLAKNSHLGCFLYAPFKSIYLFMFTHKIKTQFIRTEFLFWCGQRDLNPHGLPLDPKSSASASSAMSAFKLIFFIIENIKTRLKYLKNRLVRFFGGSPGIRTRDPLIKSQVLYRLS